MDRTFDRGIGIPAGGDRIQEHRKVFGSMSIDYKVSAMDTDGDLFIIENTNDLKGGPPWHLHHEQEEWFYVIEGEYLIEIGDERYRMGPGDSVLAPREVPHVWANVGEGRGKLLIAFRPAGKMEAFFVELAKIDEDRGHAAARGAREAVQSARDGDSRTTLSGRIGSR